MFHVKYGQMILFKIITKSTKGKLFSFQHCVYEPFVFVLCMLAGQQSLKFNKAIRNKLFHSTMISVWKYADLLRVANTDYWPTDCQQRVEKYVVWSVFHSVFPILSGVKYC